MTFIGVRELLTIQQKAMLMEIFNIAFAGGNRPVKNIILVFHKCGNNYTINAHKLDRGVRYARDVRYPTAERINLPRRGKLVNYHCANFDLDTLNRLGVLAQPNARFLVMTRHPASFVLSATRYHLRGHEKWARTVAQPHLGGQTLTAALHAAATEGEQQIISMTHFTWLYQRMTSFVPKFDDPAFMRVKVEDLFVTRDEYYYQKIADFLRLGERARFVEALKGASPAFKHSLPAHSTGSFQHSDPLASLAPEARAFYQENWQGFAMQLGY